MASNEKKGLSGQLKSWEFLDAPAHAQGIAASGEIGLLQESTMLRRPSQVIGRPFLQLHVAGYALLSKVVGKRFLSIFTIMKAMKHTHFQPFPMDARMSGWRF